MLTVTTHVAVLLLLDLAVIVAVPSPFAVTNPLESTVAMIEDELVHVTVLFVAVLGLIVADNCLVSPTFKEALVGETVTEVTSTVVEPLPLPPLPEPSSNNAPAPL